MKTLFSSLFLAACVLFVSTVTWAEDQPIEEIVVTATKRSSGVQDVAVAVSVLNSEDLQARGIGGMEDLAVSVPSLQYGEHAGTTMISIRGVGSIINTGLTEPTVATYMDGAFLPRSTMSFLRAIDLERIEVLRGPQGALYGRNSTGGAVNFISKAPTDTFEGSVIAGGDSLDSRGISIALSGPIADNVFARISGGYEELGDFVDVNPSGELGGMKTNFVRGALRIEPTDELSIDLSARYEKSDGTVAYQQLLSPTPLAPPSLQTLEKNELFSDAPHDSEIETLVATGTVNWAINDAVSLRSVTSYVDHESTHKFDGDASGAYIVNVGPLPAGSRALIAGTPASQLNVDGFDRPSESFAQEFNLFGTTGSLDWIIGAYYFEEEFSITLPVDVFGIIPVIQALNEETKSYAVYADLTWAVNDTLSLLAGVRYINEEKKFLSTLATDLDGPGPGAALVFANVPSELKSDKVLPKLGVKYQFSKGVLGYATWQKGFKSGGQNLQLLPVYEPEEIDAFEIGLKMQSDDRRLTANFAAFYYDYEGLQATTILPPTTTIVRNADAKVRGLEAEVLYVASDRLTLNLGVTLLDAEFDGFGDVDLSTPARAFVDLDGESLPFAPDYKVVAGLEYRLPLDGFLSAVTFRGDVTHSDDVVLRFFGGPNDVQDSYTIANISVTLSMNEDKSLLKLFVSNVGDELYLQEVLYSDALPNAFMGNYSRPRSVGLQLRHEF